MLGDEDRDGGKGELSRKEDLRPRFEPAPEHEKEELISRDPFYGKSSAAVSR
jgi:hypothetical protein